MTEDVMVRWHHRLNGRKFESTPRVGDGQGGMACCSSWNGLLIQRVDTRLSD